MMMEIDNKKDPERVERTESMPTEKDIKKDLSNVAGGAAFLTIEQIMRYTGYGRDKVAKMFGLYGVTYIGEVKGRRYEITSVAECIHKMLRRKSGIIGA